MLRIRTNMEGAGMKQAFRKSLAPFAAVAFTAFAPLAGNALAGEPAELSREAREYMSATKRADDFSKTPYGFGMVITGYVDDGNGNRISGEQIKADFEQALVDKYRLSRQNILIVTAKPDRRGASCVVYIGGTPMETGGIDKCARNMKNLVRQYREHYGLDSYAMNNQPN
nr:hypothetical protein GCM10011355_34940 [Aquisalinus luteolus]